MSTDLDLANSALGMLGQDNLVSLSNTVNSKTISIVNRFLAMAKEETLRGRDWNSVRGRAALALLTTDESLGEWSFSYRLPDDCLCMRRFISTVNCVKGERYSVEIDGQGKRAIYCNVKDAKIVYTRNVTNVEVWDALLFDTGATRLAWHLVGPIVRDFKMAQLFLQKLADAFEQAIGVDEAEGNIEILTNSPLVDVRGGWAWWNW